MSQHTSIPIRPIVVSNTGRPSSPGVNQSFSLYQRCVLRYRLEELGRLAEPPLSKDAVAGRLRRLLALADSIAHDRGIPDTTTALSAQL